MSADRNADTERTELAAELIRKLHLLFPDAERITLSGDVLDRYEVLLNDGFEAFQASEGGPVTTNIDGDEVVR